MSTRTDLSGARWHKSTKSDRQDCVEVADNLPDAVYVRDTKDRDGATLALGRPAWHSFIDACKDGAFRR